MRQAGGDRRRRPSSPGLRRGAYARSWPATRHSRANQSKTRHSRAERPQSISHSRDSPPDGALAARTDGPRHLLQLFRVHLRYGGRDGALEAGLSYRHAMRIAFGARPCSPWQGPSRARCSPPPCCQPAMLNGCQEQRLLPWAVGAPGSDGRLEVSWVRGLHATRPSPVDRDICLVRIKDPTAPDRLPIKAHPGLQHNERGHANEFAGSLEATRGPKHMAHVPPSPSHEQLFHSARGGPYRARSRCARPRVDRPIVSVAASRPRPRAPRPPPPHQSGTMTPPSRRTTP